ncbi:hypothetical protein PGT21_016782 [Puccinia graminis f. sp. tritici]|uniref:Major facilitator superfamily (MFS) profile domain-containing protein n=1 Tax=Puccinia graminis f. sp. tritici TaxID=56615 RepID=A0A5B0P2L7_PUCGR|nr:hypothetical protein PGTUg99_009751 [Puccinia graminis f. sp. tritici]KAA1094289.1 hypothetical protein PGT21_016782 [Puccinia graminis f. sp. tritici]
MSDNQSGFLTASYTIGGFHSSVYASKLAGSRGKQNNLLLSAISIGIGSLLTSLSNFFTMILIGRTIIGIDCGINTVLVLIYLSEISPSQIHGSVGVMNQLAIVFLLVVGMGLYLLISLLLSTTTESSSFINLTPQIVVDAILVISIMLDDQRKRRIKLNAGPAACKKPILNGSSILDPTNSILNP